MALAGPFMLIMFDLDFTVHLGKTGQVHGPVLTLILAIPLMLASHLNWVFPPLYAEDVFKHGNCRGGDAWHLRRHLINSAS